jgi:hypothetical protein
VGYERFALIEHGAEVQRAGDATLAQKGLCDHRLW